VLRVDVQAPGIALLKAMQVSVDRAVVRTGFLGVIGGGLAALRGGRGAADEPWIEVALRHVVGGGDAHGRQADLLDVVVDGQRRGEVQVGDGGDAFTRVFDEGDFFGLAVDQFRGRDSQFFNIAIPPGFYVSDLLCLLRIFPQGVGGHFRQGADAGVVEEIPLLENGKGIGISDEGADHGTAGV